MRPAARARWAAGPLALLIVAGSLALPAAGARAHTRSVSYSSWRLEPQGARVRVRIPRLELTRVGLDAPPRDAALSEQAARYLASHLALHSSGGAICQRDGPVERRKAEDGWAAFAWHLHCEAGTPDGIATAILHEAAPSHLHFARVHFAQGPVLERVLTAAEPSWTLAAAAAPGDDEATAPAAVGSTLASYVGLGIAHILTGWDHLAFVIALLVLAATLGEVARVVTGFTIAHSVTLALAVLGYVRPDAGAVEALIAFSVALVAAENAWASSGRGRAIPAALLAGLLVCAGLAASGLARVPVAALVGLALFSGCHFALLARSTRPARVRAALAFAFGLVHGFGFAGVLGQMQLPTERLAPALFGFNVGVELGQLGVVALAWPALRALARLPDGRWYRLAQDGLSAAICGIGLFWFVERAFGG